MNTVSHKKTDATEPLAKLMSGDWLLDSGTLPSWSHHASPSILKMHSKWDYLSACVHAQAGHSSPQRLTEASESLQHMT
ncbi:MAG: hypothetical protein Q9M14_07055 [Mariprofundaceae bacterium]|nr:hypothetical protein [Mariprofundaceae bacterium]